MESMGQLEWEFCERSGVWKFVSGSAESISEIGLVTFGMLKWYFHDTYAETAQLSFSPCVLNIRVQALPLPALCLVASQSL